MKYHTDDVRITGMEEVLPPEALIEALPVSDAASQLVFTERHEISDIIHGRDQRLVVVIGPCSIHDPVAALEYADRLVRAGPHLSRRAEDRHARLLRKAAEQPSAGKG